MSPVVVPVHLGCCREEERCLLCPPPSERPTPELVDALVQCYRSQHAAGRELRVGFFGGALPAEPLLEAIGDLPFTVRVRPDLLSRAQASALALRRCVAVELDALTLNDAALAAAGRRYAGRRVEEQLTGLPASGLLPGIVLSPGLPGTRHDDAVDDARRVAATARFARVHPVLVLEGARLNEHFVDGTYVPLTLGQAVSTARAMVEVLEVAGVEVVRVGSNPLPDGLGRTVAGPFHPSFRQLVDARRMLDRLRGQLAGTSAGSSVVVRCHPADETITRGPLNQHVRTLRAAFRLAEVRIRPDEALARGELAVDIAFPEVA